MDTIWRNRRHLPCRPRLLTFLVTYACNARCRMCDSWRKPAGRTLDSSAIEALFSGLPRLDAVRLTGGEPFLRPDLPEIANLALRLLRPRLLHVTTNGLLTERIVRFCERRPRAAALHLLVSLDGVGEAHDRIRGLPGAFERALATLAILARLRRRLKIRLAVNQTVVDANALESYRGLKERLARLGLCPPQVVVGYAESATYSTAPSRDPAPVEGELYRPFVALPRGPLAALLAELASDLGRHPIGSRLAKGYYLSGISARLLEGRTAPDPPCAALKAHLRLLPDGTVPTCQFNATPVGNLAQTGFQELWRGPSARRQRAWVARCPGCWAECEILPSALYSGDLLLRLASCLRPRLPGSTAEIHRGTAQEFTRRTDARAGANGGAESPRGTRRGELP